MHRRARAFVDFPAERHFLHLQAHKQHEICDEVAPKIRQTQRGICIVRFIQLRRGRHSGVGVYMISPKMNAGNADMDVLCFDIGSGGISAGRFDENLNTVATKEVRWDLHRDSAGRAILSAGDVESAFKRLVHSLHGDHQPAAAVSIACFMHSFLVIDSNGASVTPVFTWLDTTNSEGLSRVRERIGDGFHHRTGCQYHSMFPVFKLASIRPPAAHRVISLKTMLVEALTGSCAEDYGMAAASGLLNLHSADWDDDILDAAGLVRDSLPQLFNPYDIAGRVTEAGVARFGIRRGQRLRGWISG